MIGWRRNFLLENRQVGEVQQWIAENYVIYLWKLLVDSIVTTVLNVDFSNFWQRREMMGIWEDFFFCYLKNSVIKKVMKIFLWPLRAVVQIKQINNSDVNLNIKHIILTCCIDCCSSILLKGLNRCLQANSTVALRRGKNILKLVSRFKVWVLREEQIIFWEIMRIKKFDRVSSRTLRPFNLTTQLFYHNLYQLW